jgi:rod shape-determining protein MreD
MGVPAHRRVEVFRVHPIVIWVTIFAALLLQTELPRIFPAARRFDFPLLVIIYFALLRRSQIFGIGLGTVAGLTQDALAYGLVGINGMAKGLVGFLAATVSVKFDLEQLAPRFIFAGVLIFVHSLFLFGLDRILLEPPPPFRPLDLFISVMINVALGLVIFQVLDHFKHRV